MHKNNFDFLRLLFAFFVIITHSFSLSGLRECDALCKITPNHINLSYLGVRGFFIISGYLIFQSLVRSKGLIDYYWKRILRLICCFAFNSFACTIYLSWINAILAKQACYNVFAE